MDVVLALLVTLTAVLAQEPKPCESPKQFESRLVTVDPSKQFIRFAYVSYDGVDRRVREEVEIEEGGKKQFYDFFYLHNIGVEYKVNLLTKQCNKTALTRPFIPWHVPSDAKFQWEGNIGPVTGEHVTLVQFTGKFEENFYAMTVTSPDCVMIRMDFYSNRTGFVQSDFYDMTLGIHDPSHFIPPPECPP
ncbi:mammalian ependymin-related protein 1-like [Gigantopelta aegis]|uniref:mammalian ependymin-related protein 1-like n=1 Tax=Gigantopelta aegis TaxID=1735272 RepID=UPI001B88DD29|nr:mammalian ependymin-related protein 1-like [Gigantopelta aegis]